MQTKLRSIGLVVVASLLWTSSTSAATQRASAQAQGKKHKVSLVGTASWYGQQHQGRKMANGQRFDRHKLTAASWDFPLGTTLRVVNMKNGYSVVVTITDRGPNHRLHRILDLSEAAATNLDYVDSGLTRVFLYPMISFETEHAEFGASLVEPRQQAGTVEYAASAALNTGM
jgi:rare lipoprotein A